MSEDAPPVDPGAAAVSRPAVPAPWLVLGAVGLLVVGVAAGAVVSTLRLPPPEPAVAPGFDVIPGARVPAQDFTLPDLAGRTVRLRDLRGRVVLVNFWATWCAPCREEIPAMQVLAGDFGADGLAVLAVNFEEDAETVRRYIRETGMTLPVLLDETGEAARRYRVAGLPTSVLVDRDGGVVGTVIGFRDWSARPARTFVRRLLGLAAV